MTEMKIRPRNTLVLCLLMHQSERQVSGLAVPTTNDCYCEAEIIEVGPGVSRAGGARIDTFDLKAGQVVFVKYKRLVSQQMRVYSETGIAVTVNGKRLFLMEESDIGAILFNTRADYDQYLAEQKAAPDPTKKLILN